MDPDKSKMRKDDRILRLEQIPGQNRKSSSGMVDNRLFKGETQLHGVKDPQMSMWSLKYDSGILPPPLKQRFTSFKALKEFADAYFGRRGLRISEVID